MKHGGKVGGDGDSEYGKPLQQNTRELNEIHDEMTSVSKNDKRVSRSDLEPNWGAQTQRVECPCVSTTLYEWRRHTKVTTLGELFLVLGKEYPASTIYQYYRTLRVIALKRRQGDSVTKKGSSGGYGMTGSSLQAATIRRSFMFNKDVVIEEYATLHGLDQKLLTDTSERDVLFNEAVQYIHMKLLRDMSPPWLVDSFPRLCQEDICCRNTHVRQSFNGRLEIWKMYSDVR